MNTPVTEVAGIGLHTAQLLKEHGITSTEELAETTVKKLMKVPGFGAVRAQRVLDAAKKLIGPPATTTPKSKDKPSPKKKAKKKKSSKDKKQKETKSKKKIKKEKEKKKKGKKKGKKKK